MSRLVAVLLGAACATSFARMPEFGEYRAVQESLRHLPPNIRFYELERRGFRDRQADAPSDSTHLRLVGKWGGGPSVKVTGRDSLVFLSRGSEVVAIDFSDTANPRVLSCIQVMGLVSRSVLVGNRLYVGSTGSDARYIDAFDVTDAANPVKLGNVRTHLYDIDAHDSLVYALDKESLKIFSFADPQNPRLVGACRDSGYDISVANGYAYLGDRWGLYVVDVTNPHSPHRVGSWGTDIISVTARRTICCVTTGASQPDELNFSILDVSAPGSPTRVGYLAGVGGYDICLADTLAFLSGYYTGGHVFRVLGIADSTSPTVIGSTATPGEHWGVWANLVTRQAYEADRFAGLTAVDITNLASPRAGANLLGAGTAEDVWIDGNLAYVGATSFGMTILDVADPSQPAELGHVDSTRNMVTHTVVARDSFAFMGWQNRPLLRSVDVADPTNPIMAGGVNVTNDPQDMTIRDSFIYVAEDNRFQIVNVARPREPRLVGSCNITGTGTDLLLQDTLAYVSSLPSPIINVSNPASPRVIGNLPLCAYGIVVIDTFALAPDGGDSLWVLSVSDPTAPRRLSCIPLSGIPQYTRDIELVGTRAYTAGSYVHVLDVSNPAQPLDLARWRPPYVARRIVWSDPYLYLVCWDAGVCILESTQVGVSEGSRGPEPAGDGLRAEPSVTRGNMRLVARPGGAVLLALRDATGREVARIPLRNWNGQAALDISRLTRGVYFVELKAGTERHVAKVVRQ